MFTTQEWRPLIDSAIAQICFLSQIGAAFFVGLLSALMLVYLFEKEFFSRHFQRCCLVTSWKRNLDFKVFIWKFPDSSFEFVVHQSKTKKVWRIHLRLDWTADLEQLDSIWRCENGKDIDMEENELSDSLLMRLRPEKLTGFGFNPFKHRAEFKLSRVIGRAHV